MSYGTRRRIDAAHVEEGDVRKRFWPVAAVLAAAIVAGTAGSASASGSDDGKDPYQTRCNVNASIVASGPVLNSSGASLGTAYLYYSWSCGTNWAEVRAGVNSGGSGYLETDVYRFNNYEIQPFTWYGSFVAGAHSWSNMVYAPTDCTGAEVDIELGNGDHGSAWLNDPTC